MGCWCTTISLPRCLLITRNDVAQHMSAWREHSGPAASDRIYLLIPAIERKEAEKRSKLDDIGVLFPRTLLVSLLLEVFCP
jgi:hypothetical protein